MVHVACRNILSCVLPSSNSCYNSPRGSGGLLVSWIAQSLGLVGLFLSASAVCLERNHFLKVHVRPGERFLFYRHSSGSVLVRMFRFQVTKIVVVANADAVSKYSPVSFIWM